jgi:rhamnogalacturonan endolyase
MSKNIKVLVAALLFVCSGAIAQQKHVFMTQTVNTVTLWNSAIEVILNKNTSNITYVKKAASGNLLGTTGKAYLNGPDFGMNDCEFKVVREQPDLVELSFYHEAKDNFSYDLHYVMCAGVSGIYCFLLEHHNPKAPDAYYGQTRWGISADSKLFNYHLVRDNHQGPMPDRKTDFNDEVSDWTFRLPDSSYYSKYDYADYIEDKHVHGMAGVNSGYGMFVIQPSFEYLLGGPTKQFQNVHAGPFLICTLNDGHFLWSNRPDDNTIKGEWQKLSGPFLLYMNTGNHINDIWADAKKQADKEIAQWPYGWMKNDEYPLTVDRGAVNGILQLTEGTKAKQAHVILAAPGIDWQAQAKGYMFFTKTDDNGSFTLKNVRPGTYCLYTYGCDITDEFSKQNIIVTAGKINDIGTLTWTTNNYKKLWQIGTADRFTDGFKFSDHPRNYEVWMHVPANIDYTIGKSDPSRDWYYAQTQTGIWNVLFNVNEVYKGEGIITVGIAGAAKNAQYDVFLNDVMLGKYYFGNDCSVYRSAIRGGYYQKLEVKFDAMLLKPGENKISFKLPHCKPGGGILYDVVKLEINDKPLVIK